MSFNSIEFLIFFPIVLLGYWLLPYKYRKYWLLVASYIFYMSWNAWLIFLIVGTTLVSYMAGIMIDKTESVKAKQWLVAITLIVCLGTLAIFKYLDFFTQSAFSILGLLGLQVEAPIFGLLLPVGISFYTFQTLSYVIDVYRKKCEVEKNFIYYALYVTFFPQLVAGPIERSTNLLHQFREEKKPCLDDFTEGFRFMLYGFFKKICIADVVGMYVNNAFGNIALGNGLTFWIAGILFTVQIYCDFSGYSDIATGCARMMGIKLMKNFDRPLLATSIKDYGRRWHISLNSWFMEYLYFPLGGSRKGRLRKYLNTLIVFTLSGLWHGASWTFVAWGTLIGVYTILEDLLRPIYHKACDKLHIDNNNEGMKMIRRFIVILLVGLTSIFFRAQTIGEAIQIFGKMFTDFGFTMEYFTSMFSALSIDAYAFVQLIASLAILAKGYEMCYPKENSLFSPLAKGRTAEAMRMNTYLYYILIIAVIWIMAASGNMTSQFIYFQF